MTLVKPQELHIKEVHRLVDEPLAWSTALAPLHRRDEYGPPP
ncbi:hypothetical protein OHA77_19605 [Streptosporangium sp. NBC_01639]|nr:hypothetical protein OHA77_19605 [Streptosporangium sp. NBC_01639]